MIEAPSQLLAVFLGLVLLSVWLDSRYGWARKISPVVMILFLAGLIRARQFIRKKPDSAARILARIISLKPADVQEMLTSFSYPVRLDGRAERQVRNIADWLKEKKGLKIDGSAASFFAPEFLAWVDPGSVTMGR